MKPTLIGVTPSLPPESEEHGRPTNPRIDGEFGRPTNPRMPRVNPRAPVERDDPRAQVARDTEIDLPGRAIPLSEFRGADLPAPATTSNRIDLPMPSSYGRGVDLPAPGTTPRRVDSPQASANVLGADLPTPAAALPVPAAVTLPVPIVTRPVKVEAPHLGAHANPGSMSPQFMAPIYSRPAPAASTSVADSTMSAAMSNDDLDLGDALELELPLHSEPPTKQHTPKHVALDSLPPPSGARRGGPLDLDFDLGGPPSSTADDELGALELELDVHSQASAEATELRQTVTSRTSNSDAGTIPFAEAIGLSGHGTSERREATRERPLAPSEVERSAGKFDVRRWILPGVAVGALLVVVGVGFGLAKTKYGVFGRYLIEQHSSSYGSSAEITPLIRAAEKNDLPDSYAGAQSVTTQLADAVKRFPSNRDLIGRALLHESLFVVRYGSETQHEIRATSYRKDLSLRGDEGANTPLALAAYALSTGNVAEAQAKFAAVRAAPNDPYAPFTGGLIAAKRSDWPSAIKKFEAARTAGLGAKAEWQIALAHESAGDGVNMLRSAADTLKLNPLHLSATTAIAKQKLDAGDFIGAEVVLEKLRPETLEPSKFLPRELSILVAMNATVQERYGRRGAARAAYELAAQLDPLNWEAVLGAGRSLLREGSFGEALTRFRAVVSTGGRQAVDATGMPRDLVEARLGAAEALLGLNEVDEASVMLEKFRVDVPVNADAETLLGRVARAKNNESEAITHFRNAIKLSPSNFIPYMALAQLYSAAGRRDEALAVLVEAEGSVEKSPQVFRSKGEAEIARNRPENAINEFKSALSLEPKDAASWFGLAQAYRRLGDLESAASSLREVLALDADYPGTALERGQIAEAAGRTSDAATIYRESIAAHPEDLAVASRLGAVLVKLGELDEAEKVVSAVLKKQPFNAEATHYQGRVAFERGKARPARDAFERAARLDPQSGLYVMYVGWSALDATELPAALSSFDRAIELDPRLPEAYWLRASLRVRTGQVQDAIDDLKTAIDMNPSLHAAYVTLGDCYDQLGKDSEAIKAYDTALKAQPDNALWWSKLGRVYMKIGSTEKGVAAMRNAIKVGEVTEDSSVWLAEAFRLVGNAELRAGRTNDAIVHYGRYLELAPQSALDRTEIEQRLKKLTGTR